MLKSLHFAPLFLALTFDLPLTGEAFIHSKTEEVSVRQGPTPIPNGDALGTDDLTLQNGLLAVSFAVESRPPWGVAQGGILDLAIVKDGEYSEDLASLIDFMPNNWSSWPTTYQEISVLEEGPERGVIRVERDWHDVILKSTFTLKRGESIIHIHTEMTNQGERIFEDILSGYVLWADGGYFFNRPGMDEPDGWIQDDVETDWTASYEKDWSLVFHAPFADYVGYGGQDQYRMHTLRPGESTSFEGWLQVIADGDLSPALEIEAERKGLNTGSVAGRVQAVDGSAIADPIIVIQKNGITYGWSSGKNGTYEFSLPEDKYNLYAIAANHSASSAYAVEAVQGEITRQNFYDLQKPGEIHFQVSDDQSGEPLDARIRILEGETSPVEYLGRSMIFTDPDETGSVSFQIASGNYLFEIGSGAGFFSRPVTNNKEVRPEELAVADISIPIQFTPSENNWYGVDLHHHSDVLDGSTPAREVLRAQLAAGLDLIFLSDHDSGRNHEMMDSLAASRGVPFIPSMEVSPSWGHFNIFPLEPGASLTVNPAQASVSDIFDDARGMGVDVISVNHPYISYGYFHSLEEGTATGGFNPAFDLVELNIGDDFSRVFDRLYSFWDRGLRIYLAAGSDTHDVWTGQTGRIRMMVHIPGEPAVDGFVKNIKNGHAYATTGPLIDPGHMFGSQIRIIPGEEVNLPFTLMSVHGLKKIDLIGNGSVVKTIDLEEAGYETGVTFTVIPEDDSWYKVIVEDQKGEKAYSNPIWIVPVFVDFE